MNEEAAYWIFIASKLEISPLDIIIDIDVKFDALKDVSGYIIRVVPLNADGTVLRHALMVITHGHIEERQDFFIVENS
ncbi:hypothetical protein HID58_020041 [Brassica napus]|uniref:Uncharacterized protein n=1 Tax=Brassica napus TaxID=3708 RepID=A0ABQ8DEH7_BRANA|nr:hypothetical protein HID58_020041 [Brassica napus]